MEEFTLTGGTMFWFAVPMPLLVLWVIITYFKEGKDEN
jgi:hypothetical protein